MDNNAPTREATLIERLDFLRENSMSIGKSWAHDITDAIEAVEQRDSLTSQNAKLVAALRRISLAEADGLDGARDTIVLERAINIARAALRAQGEST